jgi:hypothetical protein
LTLGCAVDVHRVPDPPKKSHQIDSTWKGAPASNNRPVREMKEGPRIQKYLAVGANSVLHFCAPFSQFADPFFWICFSRKTPKSGAVWPIREQTFPPLSKCPLGAEPLCLESALRFCFFPRRFCQLRRPHRLTARRSNSQAPSGNRDTRSCQRVLITMAADWHRRYCAGSDYRILEGKN